MGTLRVFAAVVFSPMLRTLHSQVSMPISGVVQYVLPWTKRHVQCCLLQAVALQWCLLQAFLSRHQLFHADLFLKLVGTLRLFFVESFGIAMLRTLHSQISMPTSGVVYFVLPWTRWHVRECLRQTFVSGHQLRLHASFFFTKLLLSHCERRSMSKN